MASPINYLYKLQKDYPLDMLVTGVSFTTIIAFRVSELLYPENITQPMSKDTFDLFFIGAGICLMKMGMLEITKAYVEENSLERKLK